jgi:hypothetical protein
MFITVDGEGAARKIFRGGQNGINCEGMDKKIKEYIKNSNNYILKRKCDW